MADADHYADAFHYLRASLWQHQERFQEAALSALFEACPDGYEVVQVVEQTTGQWSPALRKLRAAP